MSFKLIDGHITKGQSKVKFEYLCSFNQHKVRFTIMSDPYKSQCSAVANVWNADKLCWNEVARLHGEELTIADGLVYKRGNEWNNEMHFEEDYNELQRRVALILG